MATETPTPDAPAEAPVTEQSSPAEVWRQRLAAATTAKREYLQDWRDNVNYRVMQPFGGAPEASDETSEAERVAVPEDWSRTKQKTAQLQFQIPKIVAKGERPEDVPFGPVVTAAINRVLKEKCRAGYVMDECLADVINAAGLMACVVSLDVMTETVEIPAPADPLTGVPPVDPATGVPATIPQVRPFATVYGLERISPARLLWPAEFARSDWSKATWLGYEDYVPVEVLRKHPVWGPQIPVDFLGTDTPPETLATDLRQTASTSMGTVPYAKVQIVYYKAAAFDADARHPDHLRMVVFVEGIDTPVQGPENVDAQEWVAPQPDPATGAVRPGYFKGLTRIPVLVETLAYVSDLAVPPSDTRVGRSQVKELMRSRLQMLRQRDTSIPLRWYDSNQLDELIAERIRAGEWQDMIPVNGPGDRVIGEVARANYPRENFQFRDVIGSDLDRAWSLSDNQLGQQSSAERSATEVSVIQSAGQVRLDYEKARVNRYVSDIAAVLWSLMQRYRTAPDYVEIVGADGAEALAKFEASAFHGSFSFDFVPDTSDRMDLSTKQQNVLKLYNLAANSKNVNRLALEEELFRLHGLDPAKYVKQPPPPEPEAPNLSFRFASEDYLNPLAVAVLMKTHQITPEDIAAAAVLIKDSMAKLTEAQATAPIGGGVAPAPPTQPVLPELEAAETVNPIAKRASDGSRLT